MRTIATPKNATYWRSTRGPEGITRFILVGPIKPGGVARCWLPESSGCKGKVWGNSGEGPAAELGELLKKPVNFPVMGLHHSEVVKEYKLACAKALGELETYSPLSYRSSPQTLFTRFRQLEKIFKEIPNSGIKVIIAGSSIINFALHYLSCFNITVLKVHSNLTFTV
ncbi:uncharacterized protein F5891DRAFT_1187434 [Suillus fuscotomentosus]|uniref:Uncharacterized protein n=1 Tax=Suillus fuscotomentosus TaxID=1912939 RepID=A0AAD4EAX3_9AGAM|nr:uncharacterized protein F5891DRAFT_1187434 [Suillus fuscotomentosus]KAG1901578.1 hypothetical protein F5891DRAFT_1187434 [Suillus fuscotomentosus]